MANLVSLCKETVNLGVLDGGEVLVIETLESPLAVRMSSKIGNRRYPHSTALGKVLLADLPEREMLRLIRGKGMPRFTPATITSENSLIVELERVKAQGYALDNSENEPDGRCIAAPVFNAERRVIAALSVSGPLPRMTLARARSFVQPLRTACHSITADRI
jgi:IclR family KDG regulon transcriptional repressor